MPHGDHGQPPPVRSLPERGGLLYVDATGGGVAGDMFNAALLDLGVPLAAMEHGLSGLDVGPYRIEVPTVERSGIVARQFLVHVEGTPPQRSWAAIRRLLEDAPTLSDGARSRALATFQRLADAEAEVHGVAAHDVHFHEVGAVDSIVDIVAAAVALDLLDATVVASPLPMGRGTTRSAHGILPLPAPATVGCLRGVPTVDGGVEGELVTPTGAALVATAAARFERWPAMRPERTGWGAGTRTFPDRPNVLRLVWGQPAIETSVEELRVLESNIDDMTPELGAHLLDRLLAAGALDAWLTPVVMKKGRLAVVVGALVDHSRQEAVLRALLTESSSLGARIVPVRRVRRPRRVEEVATRFGPIPVKIAEGDGLPRNLAPEFEACRAAAARHGVPLKEVFAATLAAIGGDDGPRES